MQRQQGGDYVTERGATSDGIEVLDIRSLRIAPRLASVARVSGNRRVQPAHTVFSNALNILFPCPIHQETNSISRRTTNCPKTKVGSGLASVLLENIVGGVSLHEQSLTSHNSATENCSVGGSTPPLAPRRLPLKDEPARTPYRSGSRIIVNRVQARLSKMFELA